MERDQGFASFEEFYPFYLGEHGNRTSRRLHVVGTTLVIALFGCALATGIWSLLWLLPIVGYAFAWVGHFVFEKNRPATFRYPLYSLMGDFRMWWQIVTGRINW